MVRTLEEFNQSFMNGSQANEKKMKLEPITPVVIEIKLPQTTKPTTTKRQSKKRGLFTSISDMLFSLAIFMILIVVLTSGSGNGEPKMIFNYSYFTVVTPSMQDEIPKGSFILVKQVDAKELKIGDNITYMVNRNTSVTHKIVDIFENYDNSGVRGFQTKGVNNDSPDHDIVYESNVIGKVIFVIPVLGEILAKLGENVFLVFIIFGLCVLFSFLIRGVLTRPAKRKSPGTTKV